MWEVGDLVAFVDEQGRHWVGRVLYLTASSVTVKWVSPQEVVRTYDLAEVSA